MSGLDSFFGDGFIDHDEWRDEPVRHRYVHGGFAGTDTRFSFYFPPSERYGNRFFHFFEGRQGGSEHVATTPQPLGYDFPMCNIEVAIDCGAYLVESNQGHFGLDLSGLCGDATIMAWRANAATARFSKAVAEQMYGRAPSHGYGFGGSGGGLRSVHAIERAGDVYDGVVAYTMPHAWQALFFSLVLDVQRALGHDALVRHTDAIEPGGSGDRFAGLSGQQRDALSALYRVGYPRHAWLEDPYEAAMVLSWMMSELAATDPTYFDDFWTVPGYLGADPGSSLHAEVVDVSATVRRVVTAGELAGYRGPPLPGDVFRYVAARLPADTAAGIVVDLDDVSRLGGSSVTMTTGVAAGRELQCLAVNGDVIQVSAGAGAYPGLFESVVAGDRVRIDNRKFLAYCSWTRHMCDPDYREFDQWCLDGQPLYPQRDGYPDTLRGPVYRYGYTGKMIILQNTHDQGTWPSSAMAYREKLAASLGESMPDQFRLWWMERGAHMSASLMWPGRVPVTSSRIIDYEGAVHQALRDLVAWVERGVAPPPDSGFTWSADAALTLPDRAADRRGIQPVVRLSVDGAERTDVSVGGTVTFELTAAVPPGCGSIVAVELDLDGTATWVALPEAKLDGSAVDLTVRFERRVDQSGTLFPAVRVTSQRDGVVGGRLYRVANIGRVRVVAGA